MHDYELFDKIVAETIAYYLKEAKENNYICIYLPEGIDDTMKYFLEMGHIIMQLSDKPVYLDIDLLPYIGYKIKYRHIMKHMKRTTLKEQKKHIDLIELMENINIKFNTESKTILPHIYHVYYDIKKEK